MMPRFMMQVGGQSGYILNQTVRFAYYFLWKWFVGLTLPVLIAGYLLTKRDLDLPMQAVVILILVVAIKHWYDAEMLRYRVGELEREVEDHYYDFHHQQDKASE